jgi:threonine dehydratase
LRSGAREESVVERLEASTPLENISQFDQRFQNSMEIKNESKQFETYV